MRFDVPAHVFSSAYMYLQMIDIQANIKKPNLHKNDEDHDELNNNNNNS